MIIVIEGCDQAGKLTQCKLLYQVLRKQNKQAKIMNFPDYSTSIGKEIRHYLYGRRKLHPKVIHCLLSANRWEKLSQLIKYNTDNTFLILNRYYQSNLAYGLAHNLDPTWLQNLDTGLPEPKLVILLHAVDPVKLFRRKNVTNKDRFETNIKFLIRVSEIYEKLAIQNKWTIINASDTRANIHNSIIETIKSRGIL